MTPARYRRQFAVTGIVAILLVAGIRVAWSGREDLSTARLCLEAGLTATGIDYYSRAARWYLPFSTTSQDAIEGLFSIADDAEARSDHKTALRALGHARRAILGSRWIVTPHRGLLTEANRRIAELTASDVRAGEPGSDAAANLRQLERTAMPGAWLSLLATLLFVAWAAVTMRGAYLSVTPDGRVISRIAWKWLAGSVVLLVLWLVLVRLA